MDALTAEFMAIVRCEPVEVREMAPERRHASGAYPSGGPSVKSLGSFVLYFGKHKGKPLADIPKDYLEWLASAPRLKGKSGKGVERTKRRVREFLASQ